MFQRRDFDRTLWSLPGVQNFKCGSDIWETEVGNWISAPDSEGYDSALYCVEKGKCSVWLFTTESDEVIGFSSLGLTSWELVKKKDKLPLQIVPNFAVSEDFKRSPAGPKPGRYAYRLFRDLLGEAANRWKNSGAPNRVALHVHPNNGRAIAFYNAFSFETFPRPIRGGYTSMIREITESDLPQTTSPV